MPRWSRSPQRCYGLVDARPWLLDPPLVLRHHPRYGYERPDSRGRILVTLTQHHPYANSAGWQYRSRLVVSYELNRRLRSDEHVDHLLGIVDDDRLTQLRLLTASLHGRDHAQLFELAGARGPDGRFVEYDFDDVAELRAQRSGPVVSPRRIGDDWLPESEVLGLTTRYSVG